MDRGSDYLLGGMTLLLQEDCILTRYAPLLPFRDRLLEGLSAMGCQTIKDCLALPDAALMEAGLPDPGMAALFRRFTCLYDHKGKGLRELPGGNALPREEREALLELMRLPGVKATRSRLYFHCGVKSLRDMAAADPEALRQRIAETISRENLPCTPPQPKELRTQIAVARVFTQYAVE